MKKIYRAKKTVVVAHFDNVTPAWYRDMYSMWRELIEKYNNEEEIKDDSIH